MDERVSMQLTTASQVASESGFRRQFKCLVADRRGEYSGSIGGEYNGRRRLRETSASRREATRAFALRNEGGYSANRRSYHHSNEHRPLRGGAEARYGQRKAFGPRTVACRSQGRFGVGGPGKARLAPGVDPRRRHRGVIDCRAISNRAGPSARVGCYTFGSIGLQIGLWQRDGLAPDVICGRPLEAERLMICRMHI